MPDHTKRDPKDVEKMFSGVAKNYDKINRAMCFGLDVLWRKKLAKVALKDFSNASPNVIDLACGSGDVALELAKTDASAKITASDFCQEMLNVAERKSQDNGFSKRIKFLFADCQHLPFENESFNVATISFGFRNFQNRSACLTEIARVLKPSGRLAILEVARANRFLEFAQKIFMSAIVPFIATLFGGDKSSYQYLANSTLAYPKQEEVEKMFVQAGFENVKTIRMGCGLVAITTGVKK